MGARVNYGGLVIAGLGFFLTRFTVTLAIYEDPVRFYLAGIVPLMLGLGLAAFGVALAVADVEPSLARTTAVWCVIGASTMLVFVILTLLGSTTGSLPDPAAIRSRAYLSNFLIGGSIGGTLTGLYASWNRRHRVEIQQQANRLEVLNRILRHEVLNSVAVIKGLVSPYSTEMPEIRSQIREESEAIERTIDEVKSLARSTGANGVPNTGIEVDTCLEASVRAVTETHPEADITVASYPREVSVRATEQLEQVFTHVLENAVLHARDDTPVVEVSTTAETVRISVSDDGPGLPESQQNLLETGEIKPFDDPGTGFGLNIARHLVEDYGGSIETDVGPDGTTITVVLPRADIEDGRERPVPAEAGDIRPTLPHLIVTVGAAVLAGVFYGIASELLGGSVAGIGVFYGTASPVVGWLTHEFHSLVFGFVFAGLISMAPSQYRNTIPAHVAIGIGWGLFLWIVAAGFIAPIWLRLLGIPAPIPSFSGELLVSHLAWGISLGILTAWGYRYVPPRLSRFDEQFRRGSIERNQ